MLIRSSGAGRPARGMDRATHGTAGTGTPVDIPTRKDRTVSEVRKYHVTHNGHRTIMRLNDQDVKAYPDARPVEEPAEQGDDGKQTAAKSRTAADKARRPAGDKTNS